MVFIVVSFFTFLRVTVRGVFVTFFTTFAAFFTTFFTFSLFRFIALPRLVVGDAALDRSLGSIVTSQVVKL